MPRLLSTFAVFAVIPLAGACTTAVVGTAATVGVSAAQERTTGEAIDDATVSNEVKGRLLAAQKGFGEVDVEVAGGLVLLSGRVMTPEQKVEAESIAWQSPRVREVANEIRIEPPGGFIANASDEVISTRVRSRLFGSSSVKARNFNVETYGGVVYLMGIASSADELEAAAREASLAGGVRQVVSYVRLRDARGQIVPYRRGEASAPRDTGELMGGPGS
ncbi:MAG: BON domain-containing protein [Pseudomonadota bacterium]